jgi:lipopolysaccharide/colanic/teichoic acid biosynthesis glycosyltransferase
VPDQAAFPYRPLPAWKRLLDVTGSLAAILLTFPLMLLTAVLIKLVSPGPLLFRQARVGFMGRTFTLFKFRTMKVDADSGLHNQYVRKLIVEDSESRPMVKLERNPDIIPLGRWIRTLCLDELPQLFNVLRGDMSLVGPRPCVPYEAEEYLRWHARRFDSVPGMTGLWQVSGKNRTTFKEMIRFDIKYELSRSLWLDLWIMLVTPAAIIRQLLDSRRNAADAPQEATK